MKIPHFGLERQYVNLRDELLTATDSVLKSGQLVNGQYTRKFENWLSIKTKAKYAITVHSGTQALEIIARWKKSIHNDTMAGVPIIRVPNLTFPATYNAFVTAGWKVELGDTGKDGILQYGNNGGIYDCLVGLYGKKPWHKIIYKDSFGVIVDGAQHWLVADGQVGCGMAISFDPTKNLPASGNGGAIVTNDVKLFMFASAYRDNNKPYFHEVGTNSKMSEQDCAQILVRTKYIDVWQSRRSLISDYWCNSFKNIPVTCLNDTNDPHAHQKFVMYVSDRDALHNHLKSNDIDSRKHYEYVIGELPIASNLPKPDMISSSVLLSKGVISLPIYPELTDIEVEYIADKVNEYYK